MLAVVPVADEPSGAERERWEEQEEAQGGSSEAKDGQIWVGGRRGGGEVGQVGDGGGHQELEGGLGPADVASLADAELDQAGDAVLDGLAAAPRVGEGRASLERPGRLQQPFLRMQGDGPPTDAAHALGAQGAGRTDRRVEAELPAADGVG